MGMYRSWHATLIPRICSNSIQATSGSWTFRQKNSGVKGRKVRLTYALTTNAEGSEKLEPLIIGKAQKPRAFKNKSGAQLGFNYRNNAKAWMKTDIYQDWLMDWDIKLRREKRNILLIQDNFSGHIPPDGIENIEVVNFEPNLTSHVQPTDQGIIQCFKAHYHSQYIERAISRYDSGITASEIYDINQLEAMRLANTAWHQVDATMIQNCWRKSGILPEFEAEVINPLIPLTALIDDAITHMDPVAHAENRLKTALD